MTEKDAPVEIVAYDSSWPDQFEAECARLAVVLATWLVGPRAAELGAREPCNPCDLDQKTIAN